MYAYILYRERICMLGYMRRVSKRVYMRVYRLFRQAVDQHQVRVLLRVLILLPIIRIKMYTIKECHISLVYTLCIHIHTYHNIYL